MKSINPSTYKGWLFLCSGKLSICHELMKGESLYTIATDIDSKSPSLPTQVNGQKLQGCNQRLPPH